MLLIDRPGFVVSDARSRLLPFTLKFVAGRKLFAWPIYEGLLWTAVSLGLLRINCGFTQRERERDKTV